MIFVIVLGAVYVVGSFYLLAYLLRDAKRAALWASVGTPGWIKPAPGTRYDRFGNTEAR